MTKEMLEQLIAAAIANCNDTQIIKLAAGRVGVAVFPLVRHVAIDYSLAAPDAGFGLNDHAVRRYWEEDRGFGKGITVDIYADTVLYEMALEDLDQKVDDADWVAANAPNLRFQLLAFVDAYAESVIDECRNVIEEAHDAREDHE